MLYKKHLTNTATDCCMSGDGDDDDDYKDEDDAVCVLENGKKREMDCLRPEIFPPGWRSAVSGGRCVVYTLK